MNSLNRDNSKKPGDKAADKPSTARIVREAILSIGLMALGFFTAGAKHVSLETGALVAAAFIGCIFYGLCEDAPGFQYFRDTEEEE